MSNPIVELNAAELSMAIHGKKLSCREVMEAYLDHIGQVNPQVNAIVTLADGQDLMAQAQERDRQLARGEDLGWMHGFPQAVKDLEPTKGLRTTKGSLALAHWIPDYDSPTVRAMKNAGAIVIGKTNTPEFGYGSQSYNQVFGATGNPYDPALTSGGSSGGAACALALRMQAVADGSDFMGSLRNPAGWCNVVGFRPSPGTVPSGEGDLFSNTMAVQGPMARTVADAALLLGTLAGRDPLYPQSREADSRLKALRPDGVSSALKRDFKGFKVGWIGDWDGALPVEPDVLETCQEALKALESLGVEVEPIKPFYDLQEFWEHIWLPLRHYCASGLKVWYDLCQDGLLKPESRWEYQGSVNLTAHQVQRAFVKRSQFYQAMIGVFQDYHFIAAPTAACFPFDKNLHWPQEIQGRPMTTYHNWMEIVTPWTMGCNAVCAVPAGFGGPRHLPIGLQLIAPPYQEFPLLQFAAAYEEATAFTARFPPQF